MARYERLKVSTEGRTAGIEQLGPWILPPLNGIGDHHGGKRSERHAVPAEARSAILVGRHFPDVGEAVLGFGERAAPDVVGRNAVGRYNVGFKARAGMDLGEPL